ncbi:MAG: N-formylglutamate amidohydrolase [Lysobacterales bacterium]|jgi:predicted N-formylglutamate amidohydrolase
MSRSRLPGYAHSQNFPETEDRFSLIGPGDPPPFMTYNDHGRASVLLVADHASPFFPAAMNQLGLADWVLEKHVAWDIGSDKLTRYLADALDAQAVLAGFSRLIIDPNRRLDDPTAFMEVSDGVAIPGNLQLDDRQRQQRIDSFFRPYHRAIEDRLARFRARGVVPAMISLHTCTPVFDRVVRPWHIGVLWDKDPRIPVPLMEKLREMDGLCVGDNEPYSGRHPHDFTIDFHAESAGLPHVGIEVRQDLVADEAGARRWAGILAEALSEILEDRSLYRLRPDDAPKTPGAS